MDKLKHSENRSERQLENLKNKLALTETQVGQLSTIIKAYTAKANAAKEAATEKGAARETIKALRAEKVMAIKGILNSEQLVKYEAMKKERKDRRSGKGLKGRRGAHAKHKVTTEERAQRQTERLTEKLGLSEEQATKIAAINLTAAQKRKAIKKATTEKGTDREALKSLRSEKRTAIKSILTPEQLTAYEAMKSDRKDRGRKGSQSDQGRHPGTLEERAQKRAERLTEKLGLSEEQATKIAAINLTAAQKRKATKEAATEKRANREDLKIIRAEKYTAIKAVLTPEQLAVYEALKSERKGRGGKGRRDRKYFFDILKAYRVLLYILLGCINISSKQVYILIDRILGVY